MSQMEHFYYTSLCSFESFFKLESSNAIHCNCTQKSKQYIIQNFLSCCIEWTQFIL